MNMMKSSKLSKLAWAAVFVLSMAFSSATAYGVQDSDNQSVSGELQSIIDRLGKTESESEAAQLVTNALKITGFSIWGEDRRAIYKPPTPTHGYAVTDFEIKSYAAMFVRRDEVRFGDLSSALAELAGNPQLKSSIESSPNLSLSFNVRTEPIKTLIRQLVATNTNNPGLINENTRLDPISALIIMRCTTEDIRIAGKGKTTGTQGTLRLLRYSPNPSSQDAVLPGWAEDAAVGGYTVGLEKFTGIASPRMNALMSICKFVATYKFLKGEGSMDNPPLVRRLDTSPGERRTLKAKFFIDGNAVTDWLKENRPLLALAGYDTDMPHSGPLAGVETEWDIREKTWDIKSHLVQLPTGSSDISKIKTDANGVATIDLEGAPRKRALNRNLAKPVMKQIKVIVTPQVKATEMKQDLVDAVLGAIGIKDGGFGFVTPVMETMYRMKWKGRTPIKVDIKDWMAADQFVSLTLEVNGRYHSFSRNSNVTETISRSLDLSGFGVATSNMVEIPGIDENVLKQLPPAQRELIKKQMEAAMKAAGEAAKMRQYTPVGGGQCTWRINDRYQRNLDESDCEIARLAELFSWSGGNSYEVPLDDSLLNNLQMVLDTNTMKLQINPGFAWDVKYVHMRRRTGEKDIYEELNNSMGILTGIKPADKSGPIEVTVKEEKEIQGEGDGTYLRGSTTIPFSAGLNDRIKGSIIVAVIIYSKGKS